MSQTQPVDPHRRSRNRNALAAVVGSVLEWYDFFLFSTSAALVFDKIFFSGESEFAATLASFATFAVGFAARPFGGLILAHFGDRWGRKPVLLATLVLMGFGTLIIGVLPTYAQIGVWAPALLVFCRILQGLGVGAELGGAYVWTTESAKPTNRGFYAALPGAGEFIGVVAASGAMSIVSSLDEDQFLGWGWRLPYLASVIVIIAGLVLRYFSEESDTFKAAVSEGKQQKAPVVTAVRSHGKTIGLMIGAGCATAIASYSIQGYLPSYTTHQLGLPKNVAVIAITVASALSVFGIPIGGWLSDHVGRRPLIIGGGIAIAVFAVPFWLLVGTRSLPLITLAVCVGFGILLNSMIFGPAGSFFSELLPTEVRYTGLVLARETTAVVFSGTAPFVAALLVHANGDRPWLLAGYMALSGIITAVAVRFLPETAPRAVRRKAAERKAPADVGIAEG
ncbi:MFS transporter [Amycolatopsis taiwanensis]|uniref:MFS transporter n=1 Tax=Amycolatopsis taiwanensis TaxID=342230 RepID=A0A9W6R467_9PSEU|nr:MFS transporter [Amycolatopsis taiwanensis]GLY68804.1 MFS transporter [Amycolatopsis taiwanensis]